MRNYLELTEEQAKRRGEVINNTMFDIREVISGKNKGKYVCVENAFKVMPEVFRYVKPDIIAIDDADFLPDITEAVKIEDSGKEAAFIGLNIEIRIGNDTKYIRLDPKEGYTKTSIDTAIKNVLKELGIK